MDESKNSTNGHNDETRPLGGVVDSAKGAVSGAVGSAQDALSGVVGNAQDAFSGAVSNAQHVAGGAAGRASQLRSLAESNPLGLAIGSIAAGFLLGLAFPVSQIERSRVGPVGEQLFEGAKSAASDAVEQGKSAVSQVVSDALKPSSK